MTQSNSQTFKVNRVSASTSALPTTSVKKAIELLTTTPVEACSQSETRVIRACGFHPLIEAAHHAFAEHYGLTLSPDDIWLTIAQGFAACINADPEKFRSHFVSHQGKEKLSVRRDNFVLGSADNEWEGVFAEFSSQIGGYIGEANHKLLLPNFTTTGPVEKAAAEVVLMDCVQSYFKYEVHTMCGIPTITLTGTTEDWVEVKEKLRALTVFGGLEWWMNGIYPILDHFIAASRGNADTYFWESILKSHSGSGGVSMDGWLLKLLPFVKNWDGVSVVNPMVTSDRGVHASWLPASLSSVPFVWNYLGTEHEYNFVAGHVGIVQDPDTLSLKPLIGWAVKPQS